MAALMIGYLLKKGHLWYHELHQLTGLAHVDKASVLIRTLAKNTDGILKRKREKNLIMKLFTEVRV